jgi:hypothetical protein
LEVIRKNEFNPIGSVKAGFSLAKIVDFTICPVYSAGSKIPLKKHLIRPVKKDQNCKSKPGLDPDDCISLRAIICREGKMRDYPRTCA